MKRILFFSFFALLFCGAAVAKGPISVKIISYNIRYIGNDGKHSWQFRKPATKEMLMRHRPDAFGLQEAMQGHLSYIDSICPQYGRVGVGRDDGKLAGEMMAIYYNKERFDLLDSGTFWLSETPEQVSRGWDAACNRTTTWVKLRDKSSGKKFFFFNTHLDHQGEVAQTESIKLLIEKIRKIAGRKATVFISGDFNVEPGNKLFAPWDKFVYSTRDVAPITDNRTTCNGWEKGRKNYIIDYIFYRGKKAKCESYQTLDGDYGVEFISDHYPIEAVFTIK